MISRHCILPAPWRLGNRLFSRASQKECGAADILIWFQPARPVSDFWPRDCEMIDLCCLGPKFVVIYVSSRKLVDWYNLDTQTWQEHYEKEKSQANLIDEHKFYRKQNMSKLNLAIYVKGKRNIIRLCLLGFQECKIAWKINQYKSPQI